MPASDCPGLTALPARARAIVDEARFGALTAYDTRQEVYGTQRRTILTHSPELHESQARGFDGTTLAKAGPKLDELAATLARGKTRRPRGKVEAEIAAITGEPWVRRVVTWQLDGSQPKDLHHRSRRLAGRRGDRRVPLPVRGRVQLPAAQRPARGLDLPDVPLDRAQHPRPHLHLRARPADRPPDAAQGRPRRPAPERARTARRTRRDRDDGVVAHTEEGDGSVRRRRLTRNTERSALCQMHQPFEQR